MTDRRDPDAWRDLQERYAESCRMFRAREISADVFRAKLHGLGYLPSVIETEVQINWPDPLPIADTKVVRIFAGGRR